MSNGSSITPGAVFGARSIPCVPITFRHDGSDFARLTIQVFCALAGDECCEVVDEEPQISSPPKPTDTGRKLPETLQILDHHSPWVIWIAEMSGERSSSSGLRSAYGNFEKYQRIALLLIDGDLESGTPPGCTEILMSRQTERFTFPLAVLARSAGFYLFIAWRSFCNRNDSNFGEALCLPLGGAGVQAGRYTLGCGATGIDLDYHIRRHAHRIANQASSDWLSPNASEESYKLPGSRELVAFHLPTPEFVMIDGETRPRNNEIVIGQDVLSIGYHRKLPPLPKRSFRNVRHMLSRFVTAAGRHLAILQMGALPQILRFTALRAERFPGWVRDKIQTKLDIPQRPEGLFGRWKQSIEESSAWLDAMAETSLHTPPHKPPHHLVAKARRKVEKFPNLVGGLVRWGLLAIALLWLGYGQNFVAWAEGKPTESVLPSDPRYTFGLDIASGALIVSVLVLWIFCACRVSSLIHLAEKFMLTRLILVACQKTADSICKTGRLLGEQTALQLSALETLVADWRAKPENLPANPDPSANSEAGVLTDLTVDRATEPHLLKAQEKFQQDFREHLNALVKESAGHPASGLFHPDHWFDACDLAAAEAARYLILQVSFDSLANEAGLDSVQRQDCFNRAVEETRRPFHDRAANTSRQMSGLPASWAAHRGSADRIDLRGIHMPFLAVLSVYPLLAAENEGFSSAKGEVL